MFMCPPRVVGCSGAGEPAPDNESNQLPPMFPRFALFVAGALFGALITSVVSMQIADEERRARVQALNQGISRPYDKLLSHMERLSETGQHDQLAVVLRRARRGYTEISTVWLSDDKEAFRRHVDDLID